MDLILQVLFSAFRATSSNVRSGLQGRASDLKFTALSIPNTFCNPSRWARAGPFCKGRGVSFEVPPLSCIPILVLLLAASQQAIDLESLEICSVAVDTI